MSPWICLLTAALAGEPPPEDDVIRLPPVGDLPSVLKTWDEDQRTLLRSRFGMRPIARLLLLPGRPTAAGADLGGALRHHWWTVPRRGLTWSGETVLDASGIVGGLRGWSAGASTVVGPWLGPVALRLGPALRGDRLHHVASGDRLDDALLLGARAEVVIDAAPVTLWIEATPAWRLAGPRASALPGVTELTAGGGLAGHVRLGPLELLIGAGSRARWTALGPVVDVHLLLHMGVAPP